MAPVPPLPLKSDDEKKNAAAAAVPAVAEASGRSDASAVSMHLDWSARRQLIADVAAKSDARKSGRSSGRSSLGPSVSARYSARYSARGGRRSHRSAASSRASSSSLRSAARIAMLEKANAALRDENTSLRRNARKAHDLDEAAAARHNKGGVSASARSPAPSIASEVGGGGPGGGGAAAAAVASAKSEPVELMMTQGAAWVARWLEDANEPDVLRASRHSWKKGRRKRARPAQCKLVVRPSGVIDSDPNDHGTGRGAHWRKFRAEYFNTLERTALARYAAHNEARGSPPDKRPGTASTAASASTRASTLTMASSQFSLRPVAGMKNAGRVEQGLRLYATLKPSQPLDGRAHLKPLRRQLRTGGWQADGGGAMRAAMQAKQQATAASGGGGDPAAHRSLKQSLSVSRIMKRAVEPRLPRSTSDDAFVAQRDKDWKAINANEKVPEWVKAPGDFTKYAEVAIRSHAFNAKRGGADFEERYGPWH